jgi:DNA polymerase I-like protein with 3'-5' exonuclease and polymerase domains
MQLVLFGAPESNWSPPEVLPDLSRARYIAVDTETCDPHLKAKGPGGIRGDAFVAGVSLATDTDIKIYLPIAHGGKGAGGMGNLDAGLIKRYLKRELGRPEQAKVFANALYDLELLKCDLDIDVPGKIYDVQVAEPLIDENQRSYSLERIAHKYLGKGKNELLLQQALNTYFPGQAHKGNMWRLHSKFVGPYGEDDADETLQCFMKQLVEIANQGLEGIFDLETRLQPCLFYMRMLGVPVDIPRAERTLRDLQQRERDVQSQLNRMAGGLRVDVWSANSLKIAYDDRGIRYPTLESGAASFTKEWLAAQTDEISQLVGQVRKINRMWSTFVKGQVLDTHVKGRVHCQFHPLRGDDGGAVTGRFSSSNPNLQQVPSPDRDKVLAQFARSLFIADEGCDWHCNDFSSVEPRIQLHYALLRNVPGAEAALKLTLEGFDFHTMTAELTGLPRSQAKVINLARSYGAGPAKIGLQMGVSENEAREILRQYDAKMPWLKQIIETATNRADSQGYITTLAGRRRRFDLWEAAGFGDGRKGPPLATRAAAIEAYGPRVQRFKTYTAFNGLVQGSAADVIKIVMVEIYESGLLKEGAGLHLTVHDELDFSVDKTRPDTAKRIVDLMENSVKLEVPLKVDNEIGPSWGEVEKAA